MTHTHRATQPPEPTPDCDLFEPGLFDSLGEGERTVAVMKGPAPEDWRLESDDNGPHYINDALDAVATVMSSVDDADRVWDHAFFGVSWPVDHARSLECIAAFFPGERVWVDPPRLTARAGRRAIVAVHRCRNDERAVPPRVRRSEEYRARRARLRVVS